MFASRKTDVHREHSTRRILPSLPAAQLTPWMAADKTIVSIGSRVTYTEPIEHGAQTRNHFQTFPR